MPGCVEAELPVVMPEDEVGLSMDELLGGVSRLPTLVRLVGIVLWPAWSPE